MHAERTILNIEQFIWNPNTMFSIDDGQYYFFRLSISVQLLINIPEHESYEN